MNQQDIAEQPWRKLLLTPEEEAQRIADRYFIDPETDELVGENPQFIVVAKKHGIEWNPRVDPYEYANELHDVMMAEKSNDLGR